MFNLSPCLVEVIVLQQLLVYPLLVWDSDWEVRTGAVVNDCVVVDRTVLDSYGDGHGCFLFVKCNTATLSPLLLPGILGVSSIIYLLFVNK